jgi:hypothetical protein
MLLKHDATLTTSSDDGLAIAGKRATLGRIQTSDEIKQCALSAPTRPHKANKLTLIHGEADIIKSLQPAVLAFEGLRDVINDELGWRGID